MSAEQEDVERMRIDKFLFCTRFFKTRGLAGRSVCDNGVRITRHDQTRRVDKPATQIEVGDTLSFLCGSKVMTLLILGLPRRRGPATEAHGFYQLFDEQA